jgi:hypothetical protein
MGIRFFCPNGHKLNVKEFQAGRRGICPFCGARLQIPIESTRPSSKSVRRAGAAVGTAQIPERDDPESAQASDSSPDILPGEPPSLPGDPAGGKMLGPSTPVDTASGIGPVVVPPPPPPPSPALPASANPVAPTKAADAPGSTRTAASPPPAAASVDSAGPPVPEPADPIAEAPEMIWYVRPPSGGQFGPASGDLMRTWLGEGRVSDDSLVWREGWRDWQEAGLVFPKLRSNQVMDFLETTSVVSVTALPSTHVHRHKVKQSADRNQIALLVVLSLAVIVLFVVFLVVLFH